MLGVHRLASLGADYYLADLAQELPLPMSGREGGRAEWTGAAAERLSLRGPIDPGDLGSILGGRHPATGHRLRSDRATVLGYDLTFSPPKSVSLLFALGGEEMGREVLAAHRAAVGGALWYVEAHSLSAQRGSGVDRNLVPTTGLVAATFTHGVNRNLDPHLHSHVVMANLVHGLDGRWSACDQRGLSAHRGAADAVYGAHLRTELAARLNIGWAATPGLQAEVHGMSPLLIGEFSSRSADIRRHMSTWGSHSTRGARVAWAATRSPKQPGPTYDDLSAQWAGRARAIDGEAGLGHLLERGPPREQNHTLNEHRYGAVLSLSPDRAARRRDVVAAFGAAAVGGARTEHLQALADMWVPTAKPQPQVGVAEATHSLRTVSPGSHLLQALGPRPIDPAAHAVWRSAAGAIEGYRSRWGVARGDDGAGFVATPPGVSKLPAKQLADQLRTAREIEVARQRLGWRPPQMLDMDRGR